MLAAHGTTFEGEAPSLLRLALALVTALALLGPWWQAHATPPAPAASVSPASLPALAASSSPAPSPDPGQAPKPRPPKRVNANFDEGRPPLDARERVVFTVFSIFLTLGLLLRLVGQRSRSARGSRP